MDLDFYIGSITDSPSPHRVNPPVEEVFANPGIYANWMKPLVSIDLSAINPEWQDKVHFLYFDLQIGFLKLKVENGLYSRILDYKGQELTEANLGDILDNDISDAYATDGGDQAKEAFIHLHSFRLEDWEPAADEEEEWEKEEEFNDRVFDLLEGQSGIPRPMESLLIRGRPIWAQHPSGPGNYGEEGWWFIGQLNASYVCGNCYDYQIYLFYNPSEHLVYLEKFET